MNRTLLTDTLKERFLEEDSTEDIEDIDDIVDDIPSQKHTKRWGKQYLRPEAKKRRQVDVRRRRQARIRYEQYL